MQTIFCRSLSKEEQNLDNQDEMESNVGEDQVSLESVLEKSINGFDMSTLPLKNCINIINIRDINTIVNNGIVNGDIQQGSMEMDKSQFTQKMRREEYDFTKEKDIKQFIQEYCSKGEIFDFISVAFLECIPDFIWDEIRNILIKCFDIKSEFQNDQKNIFMNEQQRLELLQLIKVPAECIVESGKIETKCVMLRYNEVGRNIVRIVWEQYGNLRKIIIDWLMELKKSEKISKILAYQISNAFKNVAIIDWTYFRLNVCEVFMQEKGNYNRNYLVEILTYYLKQTSYDKRLDEELCEWIRGQNIFLWEVAYRLYGINTKYKFHEKVRLQMKRYLLKDWKWRCKGNGKFYSKWNPRLDMFPAYYNKELRKMIVECMGEIYNEYKNIYKEQDSFADYFIWMLSSDYKMERYAQYKLNFILVLTDKNVRQKVSGMYRELWEKNRIRKVWKIVLQEHFVELEKNEKNWDYMRDFFKIIAFTGKREDFYNVQNMLHNMTESVKICKEIERWLYKLVEERRKTNE